MLHMKTRGREAESERLPLRIAGVVEESIVDGPALRFVIFVQGCPHDCPGCHNPQTHDPSGGEETDTLELLKKIKANPMLRGVTFSGGEPFMWGAELAVIAVAAKETRGLNVMVWSGYTYEELLVKAKTEAGTEALLRAADYLVDGRFERERRDLNLLFRGSSNQRILDISGYPNRREALLLDEEFKVIYSL